MITLYHNPRCAKSRAALALLRDHGVEPVVVNYLESPPDAATLKNITAMLGYSVANIIRAGEAVYRQLGLKDKTLSESALIDIVAAHPQLLQRPIAVRGGTAVIGRPPENVLTLL